MRRSAVSEEITRRARGRALVLFIAMAMFSFALAMVLGGPRATAQLPTEVDVAVPADEECPSPSPTPSTTPTPVPELTPDIDDVVPSDEDCDDDDDGDEDDDGKPGKDRDGDDKGSNPRDQRKSGDRDKSGDKRNGPRDGTKAGPKKGDQGSKKRKKDPSKKSKGGPAVTPSAVPFKATGDFDTTKLELIAAKLKARGFDEQRIISAVYQPFILGGPAAWTNTWGAPRYGPGPIVRTHEGQDVFCRFGDPVLATQAGEIEFDEGGLGGIVARLHRPDGSYWYYAHLSDVNDREFKSGDRVQAGDVIGYCGNTGNALTTPPHVHFGWYQANGEARDPMGFLVRWLRTAERRAALSFKKITGHSIATIDQSVSSRLFGDSFAPDISELKVSSQSLLAMGGTSESGAFGLAEAVIHAALAEQDDSVPELPETGDEGAGGDDHSELGEILESISESPPSSSTGD